MHAFIHSFQKCLLSVSCVTVIVLSVGDTAMGTADERPAHPPQGLYFRGGARQTNKLSVRCLGCQIVIVLWRKIKQGREKGMGPS